jgi:hypothetical protein
MYLDVLAFLTLFCCRRKWNCTNKPNIFQSKEKGSVVGPKLSALTLVQAPVLLKFSLKLWSRLWLQLWLKLQLCEEKLLYWSFSVRISATRHGIWFGPDNTPRTDPTWGQLHRPQSPDRSRQPAALQGGSALMWLWCIWLYTAGPLILSLKVVFLRKRFTGYWLIRSDSFSPQCSSVMR